ncbi:sigma-70 family RNA polymerase sigma factor [Prolixibacteraceae bacterium JC049]|nr:sigma-70 family RNA polymerase sigma factor [Prolixibacteraceae bacterium JC049]
MMIEKTVETKCDKDVWQDFKREKSYALSYIYHQNIDFLFAYGKKFTSDEELVLDVIQDLFCYLIEKRKQLGKAENIRMYLLKAFRRRLQKEIGKRHRERELNNDLAIPTLEFTIEEEVILEEEVEEKQNEIRRGLKKMKSQQQEALYYRFSCGMDYEQVSGVMEISVVLARQLVSRGVNVLRKHMKESGFIFFLFNWKKF